MTLRSRIDLLAAVVLLASQQTSLSQTTESAVDSYNYGGAKLDSLERLGPRHLVFLDRRRPVALASNRNHHQRRARPPAVWMHLGMFPNGVEFAAFVMERYSYPLGEMSVEDHSMLFGSADFRMPDLSS